MSNVAKLVCENIRVMDAKKSKQGKQIVIMQESNNDQRIEKTALGAKRKEAVVI